MTKLNNNLHILADWLALTLGGTNTPIGPDKEWYTNCATVAVPESPSHPAYELHLQQKGFCLTPRHQMIWSASLIIT